MTTYPAQENTFPGPESMFTAPESAYMDQESLCLAPEIGVTPLRSRFLGPANEYLAPEKISTDLMHPTRFLVRDQGQ